MWRWGLINDTGNCGQFPVGKTVAEYDTSSGNCVRRNVCLVQGCVCVCVCGQMELARVTVTDLLLGKLVTEAIVGIVINEF